MRILVVEDDKQIKTQTIDDCLASLGCASDWATNQQEANELLAVHEYDLILLDLEIPSRPGGSDSPDYGVNLLKQIRAKTRVPVVLMTAQHQQCVELMGELHELGIDGSISKPFSTTGRTLLYVIRQALKKSRSRSLLPVSLPIVKPLRPFAGGVLAVYATRFELCDETIAELGERSHSWCILNLLKDKNSHGHFVCLSSGQLASRLHPNMSQGTAVQAVRTIRNRIISVMRNRLSYICEKEDVIANGGMGYHLRDWITIECRDDFPEELFFDLQNT
jgi:DNA-binding response OmpR family regulator